MHVTYIPQDKAKSANGSDQMEEIILSESKINVNAV